LLIFPFSLDHVSYHYYETAVHFFVLIILLRVLISWAVALVHFDLVLSSVLRVPVDTARVVSRVSCCGRWLTVSVDDRTVGHNNAKEQIGNQ
jgi:hypothetical protein